MANLCFNTNKNTGSSITKFKQESGFSLTELIMAVSIVGVLSAIAIPNFRGQLCRAESAEAEATIGSIKSIISAFADETGVIPTSWDELNSISAIMTNKGQATGNLSSAITLPNENYSITVTNPSEFEFTLKAGRLEHCKKRDIVACIDLSNGASDLKRGDGITNAANPICA